MTGAERRPQDAELHAYVDDQLPLGRRREVEAWLEQDPELAARVAAWQQQNRLIRELWGEVDTDIPERLRRAVRRRRKLVRLRLVAAGCALLMLGVAAGWFAAQGRDPLSRMLLEPRRVAEEGVHAYRVYVSEVRHPVEVPASEEAHLLAWLSKRLGYALSVPDLGTAGYRLVGGRLLPDQRGEPAAQFMFEDSTGNRLVLYIARSSTSRWTAFRYVQEGEVAAFYWYDGDIGYALVGPADRERLLTLARLVHEQLESRKAAARS